MNNVIYEFDYYLLREIFLITILCMYGKLYLLCIYINIRL